MQQPGGRINQVIDLTQRILWQFQSIACLPSPFHFWIMFSVWQRIHIYLFTGDTGSNYYKKT